MNKPKGTKDIFGRRQEIRTYVKDALREVAKVYNFTEIETPIFERKEVFVKSVGETSDIISKEMYEFEDKKGRSMTLRPELTAPVVRSYIENKFYATNPQFKCYYYGPAFRYERPQAGRFRQFHQLGIESLGTRRPFHDAELITLAFSRAKHCN